MNAFMLLVATQSSSNAERGLEALTVLKQRFAFAATPGYGERIEDGRVVGPVFNWGVGVLMSAMNSAAKHDSHWKPELRRFVDETRHYWNTAGPVPGFDVLPHPRETDRYYDDNAWMVMALVEASEVLQDPTLMDRAKAALDFALSGEDDKLGGGIYWRESDKKSKNTCSNGPTAAACLAVYEKTNDPKLLEAAKRIYAWTRKNLLDSTDSLYWDSIDLEGKVDKTKWSYNTALMVRSGAELARLTGDDTYRKQAEESAKASEKRWIVNGRLADAGRFAHLLAESFLYLPSEDRKTNVRRALDWLYSNGKSKDGLYTGRFDRQADPNQTKFDLLDQASAARAFLVAP